MTDTVIEQRDEQVAEAIVSGRSLQVVRKEFGLSAAELDIVLEKLWPIDTQARLRIVKRDVASMCASCKAARAALHSAIASSASVRTSRDTRCSPRSTRASRCQSRGREWRDGRKSRSRHRPGCTRSPLEWRKRRECRCRSAGANAKGLREVEPSGPLGTPPGGHIQFKSSAESRAIANILRSRLPLWEKFSPLQ